MVTVLWIIAAILCVALCAYGITTAIRRSRDRRDQGAPTQPHSFPLGLSHGGRGRSFQMPCRLAG